MATGFFRTGRRLAIAGALAASCLAQRAFQASADNFPSGGFNERDMVTNYLCVTPACDVLRLPGANCICTKDNPGETRLSRLKLTCLAKEGGQWVACPVKSPYEK